MRVTIRRWVFVFRTGRHFWNVSFSSKVTRERAWEKFVALTFRNCPMKPCRDDYDWCEVQDGQRAYFGWPEEVANCPFEEVCA